MDGVKDRLGDLSWLGITDQAWFEVEVNELPNEIKKHVDDLMSKRLKECEDIFKDVSGLTKAKWQEWVNYQQSLQNIPLQVGYPNEVFWPIKPE